MRTLKWAEHSDLGVTRIPTVGREEYLDYMTFRRNARPLFTEIFGPIIGLKEEWEAQGATAAELDFSAFRYRCEKAGGIPVNTGRMGGRPAETIKETDRELIYRDDLGRTMKMIKGVATIALPMDYPVRNMDDWAKIKPLYAFSEKRFGSDWEATALSHIENDKAVTVAIPGGFDEPRQLMGEEGLCMAFLEQPELVHDILETIGSTAQRVLDRVSSRVQVDVLVVHEDMAGKSGSLAGPAQIEGFIKPYYRRVWDMLVDRGARLFSQDSDGDMDAVIDAFLDAGINCMFPMEPGAGMDMVRTREKYGERLAFHGGIDKHVIRQDKDAIVRELEYKIPPMVRTGGCVLGLDHRIPNGTPIENYRFYITKAWEIMERECASGQIHG
jgi:hypothetical protein